MARIAALQAENRQLTERVVKLEEELVLARLHRFAPKSEKHVDRLFDEAEQVADDEDAGDGDLVDLPDTGFATGEKPEGKKRGRKPLPEHLPRERIEYDLADDQKACPCCHHQMHRMGEAVSEQLHIEVKAKVLQNVRFKYACRHCDRTGINTPVILAPMPTQPLPGSIATASTLAFALVHKYVDGTPLYRLAQAFERAGVPVSRGALGHWVIGSSERHLSRIYDALKLRLRAQPLIHGDETTVQVLKEKDREATSTSYMWAYRSGEDSNEPIVLLDYQPGRGQIYPQAFLGDYRGILMSDGYTAWRTLEGATHLGCMAHSRRRFVDALKTRKKGGGPPEQALKFFEQLYRIESQARGEKAEAGETQADCIRRFRQQHSVPILIALKAWLDAMAPKVLPDSKIGDAVSYTLNQWEGPDANYVPLVAEHNRIAHLDQIVHHEVMEKFFKEAIKDHGGARISDDLAGRMAKGYWANIRKAGYGIEDSMSKALHLEDREGFKKAFQEALEDQGALSNKELEEVFDLLSGMMDEAKKTEGDSSKGVGYLKRRTLMNYDYKATIQDRDGNLIELRPRDLFEQDAELLFRRYARSMSGRIAFAKTKIYNPETGALIVDGIRSQSDLDKLKQSLKESYRLMPGSRADKEAELSNALENIDFGWAKINGIPIYGQEKGYAQWARRLKSAQFIRLMSNMGLNQIQETWKIVSLTGFRASLSQIPAIKDMGRAVASGKMSKDKLLNELADMTGIGMDNLWNRYDLRLDDDRLGAQSGGRITQVVDNVLDAGQRLTANVSFMRQIHDYQQRWAMKAITQQIAHMARKTRNADGSFDYSKLKPRDRDRMASIGLGEDDAKRLFKDLLDHAEFDGNKIVGINTMKWDPATVSKFRVFLNRYTDRLVQQNDYGALSKWMSRPVASMFVQFRTFVFGAWAKSTLWSLNHGAFTDPKMIVLFLGEIAAGSATYAVRQSGQAVTEDGWEKYWEETMDPANLLKNGFARTATASVVPMFLDSVLLATPLGPQFGQARASGSATDVFFGTPAKDQWDSAVSFTRGAATSVWTGEDMTQSQIRQGIRAFMPLGNWVPLTAAIGALIEDRPE